MRQKQAAPDRPTGGFLDRDRPFEGPPRWTFAVATVIWALVVGFLVRLFLATVVGNLAGKAAIVWLGQSPIGLAFAAAAIQFALLGMAYLRSILVADLRKELLLGTLQGKSRWFTSVLLILGLAPFANLCGLFVARVVRADLRAMELVGELVRRSTPVELGILALTLSVLPALVEESIFRGLVLGTLNELRPCVALLTSAAAFGAFHLDLAQGIATFILGMGFGFIVQSTGSLLGAMVAHASYNLLVLLSQRWLPAASPPLFWQMLELAVGLVIAAGAWVRLNRLRGTQKC